MSRRKAAILKEVNPYDSASVNAEKLAYGRSANDPIAELVRTWRGIAKANQDLAVQEQQIGKERIAAAETVDISDAEFFSGATDKELDAIRYWRRKRAITSQIKSELTALTLQVRINIEAGKADWFRRVADAIEAEVNAAGKDVNPIEAALVLLGEISYTKDSNGHRVYSTNAPLAKTSRFNIANVCGILENKGLRPKTQGDSDWQRTVRRSCKTIGLLLKKSKSGPKKR